MKKSTAVLVALHVALTSAALTAYNFTQALDHFDVTNPITFQQRYWIENQYWQGVDDTSNLPVFMFLGFAAPLDPSQLSDRSTYTVASRHFKALQVAVETRFYGESLNADMLSLDMLKYNNVRQQMADLAAVQQHIMDRWNLSNHRWVSFGASFSGIFSTFYRQKYPHMVDVGVSSSAPVAMQYDFWKYLSQIGWDLRNVSQECYNAVANASATFDAYILSNNYTYLRDSMQLCEDNLDLSDPRARFAIAFSTLAIGNFAYNVNIKPGFNYSHFLCPMYLNASTPFEATAQLLQIQQKAENQKCTNVSWHALIEDRTMWIDNITDWDAYMNNTGSRAWGHQLCLNYGFAIRCDKSRSCPLSQFLQHDMWAAYCNESFLGAGITSDMIMSANAELQRYIHGSDLPVGRLVATNGNMDPNYPYGILHNDTAKQIYSYVINGHGHISDYMGLSLTEVEAAQKWVVERLEYLFENKHHGECPSAAAKQAICVVLLLLCTFVLL